MKRNLRTVSAIFAISILLFASCKKDYHCQCSYDNQLVLVKDLGEQVQSNAQTICNSYDSTVTGEKWNCELY